MRLGRQALSKAAALPALVAIPLVAAVADVLSES